MHGSKSMRHEEAQPQVLKPKGGMGMSETSGVEVEVLVNLSFQVRAFVQLLGMTSTLALTHREKTVKGETVAWQTL